MRFQDFTEPSFESELVAEAHCRLINHVLSLTPLNLGAPSQLDGWTVAQVIAHLAQNADSHVALLAGKRQYPEGWIGRDREITQSRSRDPLLVRDDLVGAAGRLDQAYSRVVDWDTNVELLAGEQAAGFLPVARRREVEVHWVDLGLGYELDDIPLDFVERDLELLQAWWLVKNYAGALPPRVQELGPRSRWSWLVGRSTVDGVPVAALL